MRVSDLANLLREMYVNLFLETDDQRKWNRLNEETARLGGSSLTAGISRLATDRPDFFVSSFDNGRFWQDYLDQGWDHCDPSAQNALRGIPRTLWNIPKPKRFRRRSKLEEFSGSVATGGVGAVLCFTNTSDSGHHISGFTVTINTTLADVDPVQVQGFRTLATIFDAMSFNVAQHDQAHNILNITARETQILQQLRQGRVITQIAFDLGISYRMVSKHLTAVKQKLGMPTNESAMVLVVELGLI